MKTVVITGASSGIGKATAKYFHEKGWNVVATMRNTADAKELTLLKNVLVVQLDVTEEHSITNALENALAVFGTLDVLVNNAGYGIRGPFEAATESQIKNQFEVNVLGLMRVTKIFLPYFRKHRKGIIINVSSLGGRVTIPLFSLYLSSKWAVEGFTETLRYELRPLNISVKLIEPGATRTDFASRSQTRLNTDQINEYKEYTDKVDQRTQQLASRNHSDPEIVARTIFTAATDGRQKLRYPCAGKAHIILFLRNILGYRLFTGLVQKSME
ncbi:MAG: SDR family oxidoreductase [Bacteroidales bacterium]